MLLLRQTQQMALVGLLRNQDVATSLGYLVSMRAWRACAARHRWGRCGASLPAWSRAWPTVAWSTAPRCAPLLRQLDRELKRLVEQGADGLNQAAPDELVKNLLFYVAKAPSQSPRIRALKEQYRLDEALPDHRRWTPRPPRRTRPRRDAFGGRCLVRGTGADQGQPRPVRAQRPWPPSELDALLAPLKQIADTLAVLGFGQPRKVILDQLTSSTPWPRAAASRATRS